MTDGEILGRLEKRRTVEARADDAIPPSAIARPTDQTAPVLDWYDAPGLSAACPPWAASRRWPNEYSTRSITHDHRSKSPREARDDGPGGTDRGGVLT
jgi:hypothetical protein